MNKMNVDRIPKKMFNNQPEGNRFSGRIRNHWDSVQAHLKKCKIYDCKKRLNDKEEVQRRGEGHTTVGPNNNNNNNDSNNNNNNNNT